VINAGGGKKDESMPRIYRRPLRKHSDLTRSQAGQSLIEIVIALGLLASVFLLLIGGIFATTVATTTNKRVQAIDAALAAYGEILETQISYIPCGSGNSQPDYQQLAELKIVGPSDPSTADVWRRPNYLDALQVSVVSWDNLQNEFVTRCSFPDTGLQKIKFSVEYQGTKRFGEVIKRKSGTS